MINESAGNPASLVPPDAERLPTMPEADESRTLLKGRKFIVFVVGGSRYAVDSQTVSEVVRDLTPAKIPGTPSWLLGIANLRSEIVTVVETEELLTGEAPSRVQPPRHIIVRMEMMDALIAFRVEKLKEVVTIDRSKIVPADRQGKDFVSGTFERDGETFTVLNIGKLVESLKFS